MSFTRKTHVVRVGTPTGYIDMEVLDAVAFRYENGKEMVLDLKSDRAIPYIVDDTGDGNAKKPGRATRRSHMKRLSGSDKTQFLDVEVLDAIAFRDENGKEWILDLTRNDSANVYNTTTREGNPNSTRRVHDEKLHADPKDPTSDYVTVERCDTMSFRSVRGEELVIVMPSSEDGSGSGRAATYMTPSDYDPKANSVPPQNSDPSVYAFFPPGSAGALLGKDGDKIACGPLWWPRAINQKGGPWYWFTPTQTEHIFSLITDPGQYVWAGNPSSSSFAGIPATFTWKWLPGYLYQNQFNYQTHFYPFQPFGFGSLEDAILHGNIGQDWGLIDFSDTRLDASATNGLNANPCIVGVSGDPDIWQLTGVEAPKLIKPAFTAGKWTAEPLTAALAAQAATAWGNAWNATSAGFNDQMAGCAHTLEIIWSYIHWPYPVDNGETQRFKAGTIPSCFQYPLTSFNVPLWDETYTEIPGPKETGGRYIGGLPGQFWVIGSPDTIQIDGSSYVIFPPGDITGLTQPYASYIGVGQLDQTKWDTTDPNAPKLRPLSKG